MEWYPIETAPRDGTPVLLFSQYFSPHGGFGECCVGRWHRKRWKFCGSGASGNVFEYGINDPEGVKVTHWAPTPEPPK